MKSSINFKIIYVALLTFLITSCISEKKNTRSSDKSKDTITTKSGLKYVYIKKGKGRKVEPGSEVTAMLSLKVNDSVIWTSYSEKDSSFTYIADRGGVIEGYNEMAMLMREGDDVVAFLPGAIAYGEKGSGDEIPPNATLELSLIHI